jgi:hypothetical protein
MIYFTIFIFTVIARAVPACGDVASPEDLPVYGPMYDDEQLFLSTYKLTWDSKYDNEDGDTNSTACPILALEYPHFKNFSSFPYIGARPGHCGKCWKVTNKKSNINLYFTDMDTPKSDFDLVISKKTFIVFNGGLLVPALEVDPEPAASYYCGLKSTN